MRKTEPLKLLGDFMNFLYQKGLTDQIAERANYKEFKMAWWMWLMLFGFGGAWLFGNSNSNSYTSDGGCDDNSCDEHHRNSWDNHHDDWLDNGCHHNSWDGFRDSWDSGSYSCDWDGE